MTLAGLVLAGGRSSRMGQDKALLPVAKETVLLQQICAAAQACTPDVAVITPWPQRYRPQLAADIRLIQEQPLPGLATTFHGPLVALTQGMAQADADWLLVLACDLPNIRATDLQTWWGYVAPHQDAPAVWLPRLEDRWHPLCGFYRRTTLPSLQQYAATGGRSFQGWLAQQRVGPLPVPQPEVLMNLNTPADWQRWSSSPGPG